MNTQHKLKYITAQSDLHHQVKQQQRIMFSSALSSSLLICVMTTACCAGGPTKPYNSEESDGLQNSMYCQHKSTHGRDYRGTVNETVAGIPCQRWSDTQPHNHLFTNVGDHNFCRNPVDSQVDRLWCISTDPDIFGQVCSVPVQFSSPHLSRI